MDSSEVVLHSNDFWFKIVGMLQQNWAVIEPSATGAGYYVIFIQDASGVFDQIGFESVAAAQHALIRNGFSRFADDDAAKKLLMPPAPPYVRKQHPNGQIYSSGKYWK